MTPYQALEDTLLQAKAKMHGERLIANLAMGLRDAAKKDLAEMNRCVLRRYELRGAGGCYFSAAGEVDCEMAGIDL
jgi:hypothetical protein